MRILFCFSDVSENKTSSARGMVSALKALGHEVLTCGPYEGNYEGELLSKHDIKVYDREAFPETYTYDEIISKVSGKIDLIIQTDPHFYLIGSKPKEIKSVYWIMDVHRGSDVFRKMAIKGSFNHIFISQKYYMPIYDRIFPSRCHYLTWAYDDSSIFPQEIEVKCDITFVGTTGLKESALLYDGFDKELNLRFSTLKNVKNLPLEVKYFSFDNLSFEYTERAELLSRLAQDFSVRVYEPAYRTLYAKAISRGKIGFHHSLRRDITLRVFEVPACKRVLLTDEIPFLDEVMENNKHCIIYRSYFQPIFPNFDLDYEEVFEKVQFLLNNQNVCDLIALQGMQHVKDNHTFKNRLTSLLETAFS